MNDFSVHRRGERWLTIGIGHGVLIAFDPFDPSSHPDIMPIREVESRAYGPKPTGTGFGVYSVRAVGLTAVNPRFDS